MIRLMAVMVPLVFLINGFTKHDWKSAFFFAMAVAVGLTPEMLPMIVSVCLSKGALAMSRKKVIVKRLNAIQNFGGMDVLCTDKTGTLTEDRVVLHAALQRAGRGNRRSASGRLPHQPLPDRPEEPSRPRDSGQHDFHDQALVEKYKKLDEIPFDFTRRMMSVLVENPEGKATSSPKERRKKYSISALTSSSTGSSRRWTPNLIIGLKEEYESLSNDGFRVLAVATKELPAKQPAQRTTNAASCSKAMSLFSIRPKTPPDAPSTHFTNMASA